MGLGQGHPGHENLARGGLGDLTSYRNRHEVGDSRDGGLARNTERVASPLKVAV